MTADRTQVFDAIEKERAIQRNKRTERTHQSPQKYLEVLNYYAAPANGEDDSEVMARILRIAAVAVCAMEDNGVPER